MKWMEVKIEGYVIVPFNEDDESNILETVKCLVDESGEHLWDGLTGLGWPDANLTSHLTVTSYDVEDAP